MVLDSKGRLIMVTDETKSNIIVYDKSGKLLETWGHDYPGDPPVARLLPSDLYPQGLPGRYLKLTTNPTESANPARGRLSLPVQK